VCFSWFSSRHPDEFFLNMTLQSVKDLGRLTYRMFLELFRQMVGLLGRVISPSQGLYLHRTTQDRKKRTNIHDLSGIRTMILATNRPKTHVSDRTDTVIGRTDEYFNKTLIYYYRFLPHSSEDTIHSPSAIQRYLIYAFENGSLNEGKTKWTRSH
jgi:hypothetical protein